MLHSPQMQHLAFSTFQHARERRREHRLLSRVVSRLCTTRRTTSCISITVHGRVEQHQEHGAKNGRGNHTRSQERADRARISYVAEHAVSASAASPLCIKLYGLYICLFKGELLCLLRNSNSHLPNARSLSYWSANRAMARLKQRGWCVTSVSNWNCAVPAACLTGSTSNSKSLSCRN